MYAHAIAYIALIRTYVFVCNVCVAKNERDDINSFENSIMLRRVGRSIDSNHLS